jgi:choline dehydrogenase-like flavoprotein
MNACVFVALKGLRVIDASIMPVIVSAHTHAATMAIAWRGAEDDRSRLEINSKLKSLCGSRQLNPCVRMAISQIRCSEVRR